MTLIVISLFLLLCGIPSSTSSPIVTISEGQVQGATLQLNDGAVNETIEVFLGIPYAQPPVGALRLKKPEPPLPWSGVKNATADKSMCIQRNHQPTESEDCLYLDVFRPALRNTSSPFPVLVWIHGGGFMSNSKNEGTGPTGQYLATMGVVAVFLNYRLGPLGFMSTEDDSMPGNFGMMDQLAALKWIQTNIGAFGGDPASVTIIGESAGSASISLLLLSPLAKGLFARAVMESGVSIMPWSVSPPGLAVNPKDVAVLAGNELGCKQQPGPDFLACLQNVSVNQLVNASLRAGSNDHTFGPFRPRVETTFGFLPEYPLRLLSRGEFNQVSTIRGFNAQELGARIQDTDNNGLTKAEFHTYARSALVNYPYLDKNVYIKLLEDVYLENITDPFQIRSQAIDMMSDFMFILPAVKETQLYRKSAQSFKSFLYNFNYKPSFTRSLAWKGVLHAQNKVFNFGLHPTNQFTVADLKVSDAMMKMVSNFAKYDDPTPTGNTQQGLVNWQQFFNPRPSYLEIKENSQLKTFDTKKQKAKMGVFEKTIEDYLKFVANNVDIVG